MHNISLLFSNKYNQLRPLEPNVIITPDHRIVIQNNLKNSFTASLFLFNPFNYIINHFFLNNNSDQTISIYFNEFMPSGRYYIKILYLLDSDSDIDKNAIINPEYFSFQFSGMFSNFNWTITYAISCVVKTGMDLRIAAPKQYFPFFLVESLEGKPINTITTDVWSNWLLYDTTNKMGTNSIMFGYRSVIANNYIIFTPESLSKEIRSEDSSLINYLQTEQGIEASDPIIKEFAKEITAKTVFGIIHQILYLITSHLTFKEQLGEFGAKYAVLNRQGDCTEYSALFTALCRLKKLPSRLVAGLKRIHSREQNVWIRHAWSEIYYEGLWIPIDVVEGKGKIIGYHPNLIPLFKGNWMVDNMNREIKISILDDFKDVLTTNDLVNTYASLSISYKVLKFVQTESKSNSPLNSTSSQTINFQVNQEQKCNSEVEVILLFDEFEKNCIIGLYYKAQTNEAVKTPKLVKHVELINENRKEEKHISVLAPENPGKYELGIFITSIYGEIIAINSLEVIVL